MNLYDFNDTNSYLAIFTAVLITDLLILFALYYTKIIPSKTLDKWYKDYRESAVIADVFIIVIGFIITRYLYPKIFQEENIWSFISLMLGVQIIHDILFYYLFMAIPKGRNQMIDSFKKYANEASYKAIIGDSSMMIISGLLSNYLVSLSLNTNIIILITSIYLTPYLLYTR